MGEREIQAKVVRLATTRDYANKENQPNVKLKLNDGTQYPGIYQRKQSDLWDIQQVFYC